MGNLSSIPSIANITNGYPSIHTCRGCNLIVPYPVLLPTDTRMNWKAKEKKKKMTHLDHEKKKKAWLVDLENRGNVGESSSQTIRE